MLLRLEPWSTLCPRLALYDLRGHGDAGGGPSRLGHGEEEDLLRVLATLGPGPVILAGYSMGAVIALHAVASGDARATAVIGVVAHGAYDDFHRSLRGRLRAEGANLAAVLALLAGAGAESGILAQPFGVETEVSVDLRQGTASELTFRLGDTAIEGEARVKLGAPLDVRIILT